MRHEEMEEIKRHFGVVAESLRSDIQQIAEGHAVLRHELQSQREEMRDEFKETTSLINLSFTQLDQRIHSLQSDVSSLKSHVDRLESGQA
jgi:predicted  nucleic acid-binding Zn-ribbon protein